MTSPRPLLCLVLLGLSACLKPVAEPDCLKDGTCECVKQSQCSSGFDCVNGHCLQLPDSGAPGDLGTPCTTDSDCFSGPCLPKGPGNGGVCTVSCAADAGADAGPACPRGWECRTDYNGHGPVCTPPYRALCLACAVDTDCNAAGDRCLSLDGGSFCGQDCSFLPCPGGYSCRSLSIDAGVQRQCVPDSLTCECSLVSAGLTRACKQTNALATCFGVETCQPDGTYSGCDARAASKEVCNGLDDDCNGLTDQADPGLDTSQVPGFPNCTRGTTCTGKWYCGSPLDGGADAGALFLCSAHEPVTEACNGVDDDCNGQVDETFKNGAGQFVSARACGACSNDCTVTMANLARDGGVDGGAVVAEAVSCELRGTEPTCVPKKCAKGFYPAPPAAPQRCEPAVSSQCRPCTLDSDCLVPGDVCLSLGLDQGKACAQACDVDAPYPGCTGVVGQQGCCPWSNTCQLRNGAKRCAPLGDSCQCDSNRVGFARACIKTAGAAVCVGAQVCTADAGFTQCDATSTSRELCDGTDNDCSGTVDDPFINTQDSGTYDTDKACGSCTTDCTARWSPTLQHALGGCFVTPAPVCKIRSCTSELVGGGGLCRVDADCGGGRTCDGLFHQCVKACTTAAQCSSGEQCTQSRCTRACAADATCTMAYGTPSTCTNGTCSVSFQFKNLDLDDTNGCECPRMAGVVDEPETYATWPTAGLPYIDRDCDGVDGVAATSLFVWAQSPVSRGTQQQPFKTIKEALAAFNPNVHSAILVAAGSYVEQVVLTNGARLYGGYRSDFLVRDVVTWPTLIETPEPLPGAPRGSVNAEGLSLRTVLAGFTVRGYDVASRPAPGVPPTNSYGVYVNGSPGLELRNNHVVGGRAGDAVPAAAGAAGVNGGVGADGHSSIECQTADCTNERQAGGAGGTNASCGGTDGNAGAFSDLTLDPQPYMPGSPLNGQGGNNGTYQHSAPSQAALCKYDCIVPANGLNGQAAQNGGDGAATRGGAGCSGGLGQLVGGNWVAGGGTAGNNGTPGRGGGGGGAGGCVRNAVGPGCTVGRLVGDLGGTGGGGGAGGCGGLMGAGALGGGGSFGIFILGSPPVVEGNLIDVGFGGRGGQGGAGGYGGAGGQGGRGGPNTTAAWCAGLGGPGGRGGNGGAGSGGGGGCGGSAFGIAGQAIAGSGYPGKNTFAPLPLNAAGVAGTGGESPAGPSGRGSDGKPGTSSTLQSF